MSQLDADARLPQIGFAADHERLYTRTNGTEGHIWNGVPTLLLTTLGRRSGQPYRTPLIYGMDGDRYVVVASKGGAPSHPAWYLNLAEHPTVKLQVGGEVFTASARTSPPEERARLWPAMTKIWPDFDSYQAKTGREIPVVVFER